MGEQVRLTSRLLAISAICVGILALILISPFVLLGLSNVKGINWQQLGNVGQTYGVSSAILAGVALLGVAFSLVVQARQAKTERVRIVRERHMELINIVLEDPERFALVIGIDPDSGADDVRRRLFAVMWLNYARMGYQMDVINEKALRADILQGLFRSDFMRSWWSGVRELWLNSPIPERRARKFSAMVDEEYQKAMAAGPAAIAVVDRAASEAIINDQHSRRWHWLLAVSSGIAVGILIRSKICR